MAAAEAGDASSAGRRGEGPPSAEPQRRRGPLGVPDGRTKVLVLAGTARRAGAGARDRSAGV